MNPKIILMKNLQNSLRGDKNVALQIYPGLHVTFPRLKKTPLFGTASCRNHNHFNLFINENETML